MLPFLVPFIGPLVDKLVGLIPDPAAREKAKLEAQAQLIAQEDDLIKAFLASDVAQAAINAEEAKSSNFFVAGWRPFIGWTCGAAFAWAFVIQPLLIFILVVVGRPIPSLPTIAIGEMMPVLLGMLGLAGMRTYEKINDAQGNH